MAKRIFIRKEQSEATAPDEGSLDETAGTAADEETTVDADDGPASEEAQAEPAETESEEPAVSHEQIIKAHQEEAKENYDKYLRAIAELENVKKRHAKERSELLRYAGEGLAFDLLEVLDDLDRAVTQGRQSSLEELLKGVEMIRNRASSVLEKHSIRSVDAVGSVFDPAVHDALTVQPSTEHPAGIVLEQFRKAYYFKDKLLRPAQVVVSSARAEEQPSEPSEDESPAGETEE